MLQWLLNRIRNSTKKLEPKKVGIPKTIPFWITASVTLAVPIFGLIGAYYYSSLSKLPQFDKASIADSMGVAFESDQYPDEVEVDIEGALHKTRVNYTFDESLQTRAKNLLQRYRPDFGTMVALEPDTGRILAIVNYTKTNEVASTNLALKATFPAASIFKVVTAAAAIDQRKVNGETVIPFNGRSHTLYKRNVRETHLNRWTRHINLRDAFARSVNTVFGKLGIFYVGKESLLTYAKRFGFNRDIESDLPIQLGEVTIPEGDEWAIAEAASGFTLRNRMSPLQGALIAAAVANDGVMMEPFVVDSILSAQGEVLYQPQPQISSVTVDPISASELKTLMHETVISGTSRKAFRALIKDKRYSDIEIGGKTGSLTGNDPRGKCDWFVGYAKNNKKEIAIAALTIHKKYWTVRSSSLAKEIIRSYFRDSTSRNLANQKLLTSAQKR